MSSRRPITPHPVITNGNMSADITSAVSIIQSTSMISYDVSWTGTAPVGVMAVQVSNSYSQNADGTVKNAGNWTDLVLSSTPTVSGSPGNGFIDECAAYAIRIQYRRTSGTGTMQVIVSGKVS